MRRWLFWLGGSLPRRLLVSAALIALLLALAELHARGCTGGKPEWRPIDPHGGP